MKIKTEQHVVVRTLDRVTLVLLGVVLGATMTGGPRWPYVAGVAGTAVVVFALAGLALELQLARRRRLTATQDATGPAAEKADA